MVRNTSPRANSRSIEPTENGWMMLHELLTSAGREKTAPCARQNAANRPQTPKSIVMSPELTRDADRPVLPPCVTHPKFPAPKRPAQIKPPRRRPGVLEVWYEHPRLGGLRASAHVQLMPDGRWRVAWNIGEWDRDMVFSDWWFTREYCVKEFDELLRTLYKKAERRGFELEVAPRWGYVIGLSRHSAVDLAHKVCNFWQRVLAEWNRTFTTVFQGNYPDTVPEFKCALEGAGIPL